jgi:purine-binding chemotaxis protein CheW
MTSRQPITDWGNSPDQRNLVAFQLGQQTYALPIEPVVQIIEMVAITPVPQINEVVEGVINVRGTFVPVVNLRRHLDLPEVSLQLHTPIILVRAGERVVGLIVDRVIDVLSLPGERITRSADILPEELGEVPLLQGVAHFPDGMALLLDLEHLFLPDQAQALDQAIAALSRPAPGEDEEPAPSADAGEGKETPPVEDAGAAPDEVVPKGRRKRRTKRKT